MRRVLAALAVTPIALLALGGPADAARPRVTHESYRAVFAGANWELERADSVVVGAVIPSITKSGAELYVDQVLVRDGTMTTTLVEVEDGFTFTMNGGRLTSATLNATDLPALVCTYEESDPEGDCGWSLVDISLVWTGSGPLTRSLTLDRYRQAGLSLNRHESYTIREATVTGGISGGSISVLGEEMVNENLGRTQSTKVERCTQEPCP